jgi:hypothetical protein
VSHRTSWRDFFGKSPSEINAKFCWWCPGAELNHRHLHFQCSALPTELPGRRARGTADEGERGGYRLPVPECPEHRRQNIGGEHQRATAAPAASNRKAGSSPFKRCCEHRRRSQQPVRFRSCRSPLRPLDDIGRCNVTPARRWTVPSANHPRRRRPRQGLRRPRRASG